MSNVIDLVKALRAEIDRTDDVDGISEATQVKLATAIAMNLKVSVSLTGASGKLHFNNEFATYVRKILSEVNELFMINVESLYKLIESLYVARYNLVNRPNDTADVLAVLVNHIAQNSELPVVDITAVDLARLDVVVGSVVREAFETTTV